ncbi:MAG: ComF family protein [Gammaproteobacteria bacterium]|nr:ComF family protein [Gammaproteobacteria bacterium]
MVDDSTAAAVLPGLCAYCGAPAGGIAVCAACARALPWNAPACRGCAMPVAAPEQALCAECAADPPPFDAAFAAFRFEPPVQQAVHGLKYEARFHFGRMLGRLMAQRLAARPEPLPELLIPVPLHRRRLARRGYNQALLLARELAAVLALRVEAGAARRCRATADQIGQSRRERRHNMQGAFVVERPLAGLHVALLDDVMTTGATLGELARACRAAGAARVEAWVAARVV